MNRSKRFRGFMHHVSALASFAPCEIAAAAIERYTPAFDAVAGPDKTTEINFFVFHVDVPASHRSIDYLDVKHDHWQFDYQALTSHFIWASLNFHRRARIYYVTSESAKVTFSHPGVTVVRLAVDARAPMYERVRAMAAYVHSRAFTANTVFLDSDAFPNCALNGVFKRGFDLGVTYRTTPGFMPLNEGVIFCARQRLVAARKFFHACLATYEILKTDPVVCDYYGDIERWRGGQLSLNAVGLPHDLPHPQPFERAGIRISPLPCNKFNYWVTKPIDFRQPTWDTKFVLHLKGDSKHLIGHVADYQLGWRLPSIAAATGRRHQTSSFAI